MGVGEVGIGMARPEILQRGAVAHTACGRSEHAFEQALGVGASHRVHGIEGQRKITADQLTDAVEIEELLHQLHVVVDSVDDLHHHGANGVLARSIQANGAGIHDRVLLQGLGALEHGIGEGGRRWSAIRSIHLDAEIP